MSKRITKLLITLVLPIGMLIGILLGLIAFPDNQPAKAQFSFTTPVWEQLDTNGDGTGTTNATGNYTTTTTFYLQPPAASTYVIDHLIVSIEDSAVVTYNLYGAITTTNGIVIQRVSGSSYLTLTNSLPITANQGFRRYCTVNQTNITGTKNQLQAICDLGGLRLNGDKSETLEVLLNDDFSGLDGHFFTVQGYKR